jgi:putative holliday junction resolvase
MAAITSSPADFASDLPQGGALAGLDVGTKTIGLALCDSEWHFAGPAETIRRTKFTHDLAALAAFIAAHRVAGLVVGLPLNMDGSDSPRTQSVRAFARNLAPLGKPVLLWDERWSTQAVERAMVDADVSRAKRAVAIDKLAAAHILQGAIDALANLPPSR